MLTCPSCGHENSAESKFCSQCGTALAPVDGDTTRVIPVITDESVSELSTDDKRQIMDLPAHSAFLLVRRGTGEGGRFLLNQEQTLAGRHPRSDIFLDDITVSRRHARFTLTAQSVTVEDLGSLNGTYVNRVAIEQPTALHDGDEVQIGKFRMAVYVGGRG